MSNGKNVISRQCEKDGERDMSRNNKRAKEKPAGEGDREDTETEKAPSRAGKGKTDEIQHHMH